MGADGVELDVRLCATGEVVVFHDATLDRLTGRVGRVDRLSLEALREVRIDGESIPLLDEVLAELDGEFAIIVEIKSAGPRGLRALVDAVISVIERHAAQRRVLVSSFDATAIWWLHRSTGKIPGALVFHAEQQRPSREAWVRRLLRPIALHPQHQLVAADTMRRWQREGYLVNTWTVGEPAEARRLVELGVNALMTNDPAMLRAEFGY